VILIEPGFIRTNFSNAAIRARRSQDPASPYSGMMQKTMATMMELAKNASPVELVANAILDAATNPNPQLRYLVGKDVESWAASKKNMDDLEFFNMMKKLAT
jgi:hypothetical protein